MCGRIFAPVEGGNGEGSGISAHFFVTEGSKEGLENAEKQGLSLLSRDF